MQKLEEWVNETLSELLQFPVPPDLVEYILKIQDERDLEEYLKSFLDYSIPRQRNFILNLKKQKSLIYKDSTNNKTNNNAVQNNTKKKDKKKQKITKNKDSQDMEEKCDKLEKKKTKFVNLYSQEGEDRTAILLKGRHKCNCEARKHKLVNNCINCGRIVCYQEGSGPCFCCGELVCSVQEQLILSNNSKQSDTLYNKLMDRIPQKDYEESIKRRDKLIDFDRNSAQRTKVIDDQSDYYRSTDVWLSAAEREKLKKHEAELNAIRNAPKQTKITLDFMGRNIIEEDNVVEELNDDKIKELLASIDITENSDDNNYICPNIEFNNPTYVKMSPLKMPKISMTNYLSKSRLQDKEYLEMADEGWCLSMHQPYASLLVAGIKKHEGRVWYSSHRGRLWIAAAARIPSKDEITTIENYYRALKGDDIKFPQNYPTGCLLGCTTVVDVLPQDEYKKMYSENESDSPYVFICQDSYSLPIKFPIKGQHKIFKMDNKIHQAANKSLQKILKMIKE